MEKNLHPSLDVFVYIYQRVKHSSHTVTGTSGTVISLHKWDF